MSRSPKSRLEAKRAVANNADAAVSHAPVKPRLSHARFPLRNCLRLTSSIMPFTEHQKILRVKLNDSGEKLIVISNELLIKILII